MEENQLQQNQAPLELPQEEALTALPETPVVPRLPEPEAPSPTPLKNTVFGGALLVIALVGALSLGAAAVPEKTDTNIQTAAAAAPGKDYFEGVDITAKSAYVYDALDDKELFTKNPSAQLPLASITKIMLVSAISEVVPLDATITISKEAVAKGGGGLTWGEEWKARDLIDFTLITSSNTGAEALAAAADPLIKVKFPDSDEHAPTVWRMNALARELGLEETYFINASGLDESTTQAGAASSARDIASLFAYILRTNYELFANTARTDLVLAPTNFPERAAHNTNQALAEIPHLLMGKTGTTDLAGGNLAIVFDADNGHPIIIVVMNSTPEGRYVDVKKLIAAAKEATSH